MRLLIGTFILSATVTFAVAQQGTQPAQTTAGANEVAKARLMAELAAIAGHGSIKNSPLSAEEVNESVQTLADGNRIVRKTTGKMYRNSDGRVRREMSGGVGGMLGTTYTMGQGISIATPVEGQLLSTNLKAAKVVEVPAGQGVNVVSTAGSELTTAQKKAIEELRIAGRIAPVAVGAQGGIVSATGPVTATTVTGSSGLTYTIGGQNSKFDVKTEDLGTRDFEGVSAQGTRRITTIPADAIGNERPIETVYERWFSKDLGLVVYSKNSDPRFGEQVYRLVNIVRAEPDPSLFAVPVKKTAGEPATVYRMAATAYDAEKAAKAAAPKDKP